MKHSCLVAVPHLMALLTPVAQQKVNSLKLFFSPRYGGENKLMSLKVHIAGAPASGQSRKATEFS